MKAKKNSGKAKKRTLAFLALMLVAVMGIGSGLAYLTDYDAATNKFTLGDVDIDLDEPNWKSPTKAVTAINGDSAGKTNRSGDEVLVGDVLTYAVTATNGDVVPHGIVITDTLEDGLTIVDGSVSNGGSYDDETRTITWTITDVPKLTSVTVYFDATVNVDAETKVDNDAYAKVGDKDKQQTNLVTNPLTEEERFPEKKVADTSAAGVNNAPVTVGDLITYELLIYNNSGSPATVTVTDKLDPQVSFVEASDGGQNAGGTVNWTLNAVPAHSSRILTLTVKVESVVVDEVLDPITNQFTEKYPGNSYDSNVVTNPVQPPENPKKPVKSYDEETAAGQGGAKVNIGDTITYKVQYYNHEAETAEVVITDVIDAGLTVDVASISDGGSYNAADRVITWTIPAAPAQANGFVTFKATVNTAAVRKVVNQAEVTVGDNPSSKTNLLVNPTEDTSKPGDTEIKDPTVTALDGDSFLRYKVELQDKDGNPLTDAAQIAKILETIYYDTSYVYQGAVADPSTLTVNIVKGKSYSSDDLAALAAKDLIIKEYNTNQFEYDETRAENAAIRYYNYKANGGVFKEGEVATLFTNSVLPSDWTGEDFDVIGKDYIIKVTAQACQIENLTRDEAYEALDKATA